ncbi:MAG: RNA polymerase sigma factor [Planctomycetota bacterium]|jgi:RNA polymerase sigma-70 factor (ECF subfamily)
MEKTDKSLLDAHRQGDSTAFGELVRRYGDSLLGYLVRMSGSRERAEDLLQETFKRVHEKAHTFRGPQFKGWLFKIATRVAIDGVRKANRLKVISLNQESDCGGRDGETLEAVAVADNSCNPTEQAVRAEQTEQVRQAIQSLPARQRATLVMAYYQQLSYREVATALGCSEGTVKTQMYRALRTLAQRLPEI